MVKRSKGIRSSTRGVLRWHPRLRGKVPITHNMRVFALGERAHVLMDPRVHGGMPHRRYQGRTGVVIGHRGDAVELEITDGGKRKMLVIRPEHLTRA